MGSQMRSLRSRKAHDDGHNLPNTQNASGLYPSDNSILNRGQRYGRRLSMDTDRRYVGHARVDIMPQVDLHLTLDGRHALVIHNDLPCVPDEPPQTACGETG